MAHEKDDICHNPLSAYNADRERSYIPHSKLYKYYSAQQLRIAAEKAEEEERATQEKQAELDRIARGARICGLRKELASLEALQPRGPDQKPNRERHICDKCGKECATEKGAITCCWNHP